MLKTTFGGDDGDNDDDDADGTGSGSMISYSEGLRMICDTTRRGGNAAGAGACAGACAGAGATATGSGSIRSYSD